MAVAALFGSLGRSYLGGAVGGWGNIARIGAANGVRIGSMNALRDLGLTDAKAVVELPDLKALEMELKKFGPKMLTDFKRQAKNVGNPARDSVRKAFREVNSAGPLGAPKRKGRYYDKMDTSFVGRLSWHNARSISARRSIDVNYKNRNESKALRDLAAARDGTISIVRVRVRAPAYIVADMAGKSNSARKATGEMSREYRINLFNKGVVTRRHRVNVYNTENWISALNSKADKKGQSGASRYAWPAFEKHQKEFKKDISAVLNNTIQSMNRILEK